MKLPVLSIDEVAPRQLCTGCGVCAAAEPGRYRMGDAEGLGRRPFVVDGAAAETGAALEACPGVRLRHSFDPADPELIADLARAWGPVRRVWEGYAGDQAIRHAGSSGGAASALSLYCLERGGFHGVLHTAAREDSPHLNRTVMSRSRDELLARTGSRYAPASPCEGLGEIEAAPGACVFIGKPCDVAGARRAAEAYAALAANLGLTIAFFCAGAPSTRGTLELLKKVGVEDPSALHSLRYRGNGWPGMWTARWTDASGAEREASLTYDQSWDFLQRYRQWRCYICPDHTGEFADISVGDPWYRPVEPGEPGKSLVIARTERGERMVLAAAEAGYLVLEREDATLLPRSQPNLLRTRGRLWGQLLALRLSGAGVPRYEGFSLFANWRRELGVRQKMMSVLSTLKRVKKKGLRGRVEVREAEVGARDG